MKKKLLSLALALALALAMCLGLMAPAMAEWDQNSMEVHFQLDFMTIEAGSTEGKSERNGNSCLLSQPVISAETSEFEGEVCTLHLIPIGTAITLVDADGTVREHSYVTDGYTGWDDTNPFIVSDEKELALAWGGSGTYLYIKGVKVDDPGIPAAPPAAPTETPPTPSTPPAPTGTPKFSDVSPSAWYAEPVEWAVAQGITTGTSNTAFSPNDTCTHAQILTFLWRAQGQPEPAGTGSGAFSISPSDYYYKAVLWAEENNLFAHVFNTDLTKSCTRQETVLYLWSLADHPSGPSIGFTDVPAGSASYMAVGWAVEQGITTGTSDTTFSPNGTCTRAEIVTFLYRAFADK